MRRSLPYRGFQWFRGLNQRRWLPLCLGIVATIASLQVWQQLWIQEQVYIEHLVQQEVTAIEAEFNQALNNRVESLQRMANRWQANNGTSQAVWEADATALEQDFDEYQTIQWVDSSLHVRWVAPSTKHSGMQNLDLQQPRLQAALERAQSYRHPVLARIVSLDQGNQRVLVVVPLFVGNRFDGFIVGVFSTPVLFNRSLRMPEGYQARVYDGNELIYNSGSLTDSSFQKTVFITAYGVNWRLKVLPKPALLVTLRSQLPEVVLLGGVFGSWILALTVYLGQQSERQAQRARKINQQLQEEIAQRQHVETILQESEERLQLALEASSEGWWDWNVTTGKVFCSLRYLQLLGYEVGEFPESVDAWKHSIHPDDFPNMMEQLTIHMKDGAVPYACDYRIRTKSGNWQWISDYGKVVTRDAQNTPLRMIGTFKNIGDRKQAEEALRQSEARFQAFMDHSPAAAWITDANGIMLYASQTYLYTFQLPITHPIGKSVFELYPYEIAQQFLNSIQTVAKTREALQTIEVAPYKDGTMGDFLVYKFPIPDASGQTLVGGVAIDITWQHRAEAALRQSEATKQAIIQAIPDLLIRMRSDGRYLDFITSPEFNIVDPQQICQEPNVFDILSPDLAQLRMHYTQTALESGITQVYEQEILIQGQQHHEEVRIAPLLQDEVLIMVRDITNRKQMEKDLQHQKEMFQAIVNHIPVMIALFNAEGHIEFINPELEQILGWSLQDWQHHHVLVNCYPDPVYRQSVVKHMLAATGKWKDLTTLTATGQSIETTWANVRLSNGYFLGIGQDISDRKHKEVALRQTMEAAEAANRAKSIFLANMSHELRTPLNVILGFTQVMAHDPSLSASHQEDLQTIRRSGDHLLRLINDVLDLSKIEAGHCTLEETTFDLIALLHSLRTMMAERASSKRLQLEFDIASEVPQFVVADEQKLRQILLNLLSNAIKFTEQGKIRLEVSSGIDQAQPLIYPQDQTLLKFEVTDTGIGIAPEELHIVFDAFVQAEAGKKLTSGTGLGLAISRKLLELMHGSITVHSTPNVGSTFMFTVPVRSASSIHRPPEQGDRLIIGLLPGQPPCRILVVDDQPENRLLLVRLLTSVGLEVREASNGQDAVRLWQEWQPNLTWMDIRMPVMDGYEATRQIRAMEQGQPSIIIALTAQASESDRTLALAAGCNDYISKPFREDTLFLKLKEYLGLEYRYVEPDAPGNSLPMTPAYTPENSANLLDPTWFASLAPDWLSTLEDAAICGNDRTIVELAAQLPPNLVRLGATLIDLAEKYQFEQILQLVHGHSGL